MPLTFCIASLNPYTQKQESTWCHLVGVQHPPKWEYSKSPSFLVIFFVFLWTKLNFLVKLSYFAYSLSHIFGKLLVQRSMKKYLEVLVRVAMEPASNADADLLPWILQPGSECGTDWFESLVNESVTEWVSECVGRWVNKWVWEWVSK